MPPRGSGPGLSVLLRSPHLVFQAQIQVCVLETVMT